MMDMGLCMRQASGRVYTNKWDIHSTKLLPCSRQIMGGQQGSVLGNPNIELLTVNKTTMVDQCASIQCC